MKERKGGEPVLFIDERAQVHSGEEAERLLSERGADGAFCGEEGILSVPEERWAKAQQYERTTWVEKARRAIDDRNRVHARRFDGYRSLLGKKFERAIELGCGPFTNMRYILEQAKIREVSLLDPLLFDYLEHPACRYAGGRLGGLGRRSTLRLLLNSRRPWHALREAINAATVGGLRGRLVALEPTSIEASAIDKRFDLVVMINVLEHCRDANVVFERIMDMLVPDGILVFHDKLYETRHLPEFLNRVFDAGHPLRVSAGSIEAFLSRFKTLMRSQYASPADDVDASVAPFDLYFVGRLAR